MWPPHAHLTPIAPRSSDGVEKREEKYREALRVLTAGHADGARLFIHREVGEIHGTRQFQRDPIKKGQQKVK